MIDGFLSLPFSHYRHTKLMLSKSSFKKIPHDKKSVLDTVFENDKLQKKWLDGVKVNVFLIIKEFYLNVP